MKSLMFAVLAAVGLSAAGVAQAHDDTAPQPPPPVFPPANPPGFVGPPLPPGWKPGAAPELFLFASVALPVKTDGVHTH
jgi:hypothetical protein